MHRQIRYTSAPVQLVKREDGSQIIVGYAAVYYNAADPGTEYQLYSDMVERIKPGAFDRALTEKHDAAGLFNHDPNLILGRVSASTLRLSVDAKGLRYEIDPPDTQAGRDVVTSLARGDVRGSSFAFSVQPRGRVVWEEHDETWIRWIEDLDLWDASPVVYPAYASATSGLAGRAGADELQDLRGELEAWKRSQLTLPQREKDRIATRAREIELRERGVI